jgi:AmmeMemoRadiSam system protein A
LIKGLIDNKKVILMVKKENFDLNAKEKRFCVELARKSISFSLQNEGLMKLSPEEEMNVPKKLLENKACFVTLKINNELRGCIGHLAAIQPLYLDIIENAFAAAFSDPRFPPLHGREFSKLKIEVSVLTDPFEFEFKDANELLKGIVIGKDGLIIRKGYANATFLPSVWEEIKSKEEFLSHLCMKAGLRADEWKFPGLKVQKYYAIKAEEE